MNRSVGPRVLVFAMVCASLIIPCAPAFAQDDTLSGLFAGLAGDFRDLPSRESALWLGIGASAALVGHVGDRQVSREMSDSNTLHDVFESGRHIGGMPMQFGGAVATYAIGRIAGSSRTTVLGAELLRAHAVTAALTLALKVAVDRTRPDGTSYSFPSGHTSSTFASATILQRHFRWKLGIPAYAVASYVAVSRIQGQRHYLSDVAFDAALGILAGRTVTAKTPGGKAAFGPLIVPGGGGLAFTWVSSH